MTLPVRNLRLRNFSANSLDINSGSSGEIYWDTTNNTLRIFSGQDVGGQQLATNNLSNVDDASFLGKAISAGINISPGTVNTATSGSLAYYANNGTAVSGQENLFWSGNKLTVTGSLQVNSQKNFIRFHWDTLTDLQNEADPNLWHGMIAHVHSTGRLYYAHSGQWTPVPTQEDLNDIAVPTVNQSFSEIQVAGQSSVIAGSTGSFTLVAGTGISITTNSILDTVTIAGQSTQNTFNSIAVAGQNTVEADQASDTLTLVAGSGITLTTDSTNDSITITGSATITSIDQLADVDTTTTTPLVGQVLKWFGTSWRPATDATVGGAGTDADTLDGQDSSFYLDFGNQLNKPFVFQTISSTGQTNIAATQYNDTLAIEAGNGITVSTDNVTKSLTIDGKSYELTLTSNVNGPFINITDESAVDNSIQLLAGSGIAYVTNAGNKTITISATASVDTFKNIVVSGQPTVSAAGTDILTFTAGTNIQLSTNSETKNITISAVGVGGASNTFANITVAGQNTLIADDPNDTMTIVAGSGISLTTNAITDTLTINNTQNTFSTITVGGSSIAADTASDTLTINNGSGISFTVDTATDTFQINNTGVLQLSAGTGISLNPTGGTGTVIVTNSISSSANLTDLGGNSSGNYPGYSGGTGTVSPNVATGFGRLSPDKFWLQAMMRFSVGFVYSGIDASSGYRIDSHYGTTIDPTIYVLSGTTVAFTLNTPGHPFQLLNASGAVFTAGLIYVDTSGNVTTGANANNGKTTGTIYWNIQETVNGNYGYQCTNHPTTMGGTITVKRISVI